MTFLQPWAVWFFAGAPIIVLLYFLRHKRRPLTVSTHLFWQRALQETSRRALFQRLRHMFSLLLQLLIFALIVGALARPSFERAIQSGASTVIVLDARARMQATEADGQTRFARAVAQARAQARLAGEQQQIALIVVEAQPAVIVPFVADEKPLLDALEHTSPSDAGGDLPSALRLAETLLSSRQGEKHILLLSDRPAAPASPAVVSGNVASPRDNVAITRLATRPLPGSPETSEVLLELQNFSNAHANTEVELSFDGRTLEVKPFTLKPGERSQEILTSVPRPARNARGWLTARLTTPDALPLDDFACALLPPHRPARVLLVSAGNPFLEKFLAVDSTVKFQLLAPEGWQPALASKFEAVIFDGTLPPAFDLAAAAGKYLFLKNTPFPSAATLDQPLVTDVDLAHPTTRNVSLQNVAILRAAAVALPVPRDGWTFSAPLRSFEHPLLITGERRGQRLAALAFDVLESDLPLRIAFPLLMSNTLHWLAGERPEPISALSAGDTLALAENEHVSPEPLLTPPAQPLPISPARFFQPRKNGFYAVTEGEVTRWLAVNTFDPAESDLRSAGGGSAPAPGGGAIRAGLGSLPPWQWLALVALTLFTAEWWLFHRRKTE